MSDMILIEPFALTYNGVPGFTVSLGNGGENLARPKPREIWKHDGVSSVNIDIDFGVPRDWDTVALVNVQGSDFNWSLTGGDVSYTAANYAAAGPLRLRAGDGEPLGSAPALFHSENNINSRYIRLSISSGSGPVSAGVLVVGKSWKPTFPRELGAGRPIADTGTRSQLLDGDVAVVDGALVSGFRWTFGDLEPDDLKRLFGIVRRRRTTQPLVLVEDPAEQEAEGFHYCTFVSLEQYERNDASKSRWNMTVGDWL